MGGCAAWCGTSLKPTLLLLCPFAPWRSVGRRACRDDRQPNHSASVHFVNSCLSVWMEAGNSFSLLALSFLRVSLVFGRGFGRTWKIDKMGSSFRRPMSKFGTNRKWQPLTRKKKPKIRLLLQWHFFFHWLITFRRPAWLPMNTYYILYATRSCMIGWSGW